MAGRGETIVVPAGEPHSEGNPVTADIEGIVELRPALHPKNSTRRSPAWSRTARPRRGARPRTRSTRRHLLAHPPRKPDDLTADGPQNLILPPLWALAKVFGVRPYYDRWDSRI